MVGLFDKGWISNTIIHASSIKLWIMIFLNDKRNMHFFNGVKLEEITKETNIKQKSNYKKCK
jgi:hypothetical protein